MIRHRVRASLRRLLLHGAAVIARLSGAAGSEVREGQIREFAVPRRSLRYFDADTGVRRGS